MSQQTEVVPAAKKPRETYAISPEDFMALWQTSATAQEATDRMSALAGKEVPKDIVLSRASAYRKRGIPLKKMPRNNPRTLKVDQLKSALPAAA